jgi:hypothetical protein
MRRPQFTRDGKTILQFSEGHALLLIVLPSIDFCANTKAFVWLVPNPPLLILPVLLTVLLLSLVSLELLQVSCWLRTNKPATMTVQCTGRPSKEHGGAS